MKRRPKKSKGEAAGHAAQLNSSLRSDKVALTTGRSAEAALEIPARLEALERAVEMLTEALQRRQAGSERLPGWLEIAAGNPHDYDEPAPTRTAVCVRIMPGTYRQVQRVQRRLGLQTKAGTWEFLLRLGLAAAERLPTR